MVIIIVIVSGIVVIIVIIVVISVIDSMECGRNAICSRVYVKKCRQGFETDDQHKMA